MATSEVRLINELFHDRTHAKIEQASGRYSTNPAAKDAYRQGVRDAIDIFERIVNVASDRKK